MADSCSLVLACGRPRGEWDLSAESKHRMGDAPGDTDGAFGDMFPDQVRQVLS